MTKMDVLVNLTAEYAAFKSPLQDRLALYIKVYWSVQ